MRRVLALIALLAVAGIPALAADNPYAVAGISDPAHVTQFLARLKQSVASGDRAAVASMVDFPLTVHEVKGAIKQKIGGITNNPNLQDEGTAERINGTVEKKVGQVKKVFGS